MEFYYVGKTACTYWYWGKVEAATRGLRRRKTVVGGKCALPSAVLAKDGLIIRDNKGFHYFYSSDVNECAHNNGGCTEHSTCKNTPGSYECVCDAGYKFRRSQCVGQFLISAQFLKLLFFD